LEEGIKVKSRKSYAAILVLLLLTGIFSLCDIPPIKIVSADAAEFRIAPLNPKFVEWQEKQKQSEIQIKTSEPLSRGGVIPDPVDWSHLAKTQYRPSETTPLPVSYDARTDGAVTDVRNQYPYWTCWAFSAFASLESTQKKLGITQDFSERHLAWFAFNDHKGRISFTKLFPDEGVYYQVGNNSMAAAILSRGTGPVAEEDCPYSNDMEPADDTLPRILDVTDVYRLYISPLDDSPDSLANRKKTNDAIKRLIMSEGVVSILFCFENEYFDVNYWEAYCFEEVNPNHAVAIVGWDDDYSFKSATLSPPENGAWIVKNSYGAGWGKDGYFYLSYYDKSFLGDIALFKGKPVNSYKMYLYDPLGHMDEISPLEINAMWGANIFTADEDERIEAVAFNTSDAFTDYEIRIYKNPTKDNPSRGTLAAVQTGNCAYAGYHTIPMDSPVPVRSGDTFSVVIKISKDESPIFFPVEANIPGFSDKATSKAGESFISVDKDLTSVSTWFDLYLLNLVRDDESDPYYITNLCIRALSNPNPVKSSGGGCNTGTASAAVFAVLMVVWGSRRRKFSR